MIQFGGREVTMGSRYLSALRESNDILTNVEALRQRMEEDGYLFIRGFHQTDKVLKARVELLEAMRVKGILDPDTPLMNGVTGSNNKGWFFRNEPTGYSAFLELVNSGRVMDFFQHFLDGECITYDTKWFRAVPKGQFLGAHYDVVYMGKGTHRVYTMWTPIGDIPPEMGGLALCVGSHRFERLKSTYGQSDYERVQGVFTNDPIEIMDTFGGHWATASYEAGDALIFGMYTMHASLTNTTDRLRLSSDTRYQLKSDPVDARWYGNRLKGESEDTPPDVSITQARTVWGI